MDAARDIQQELRVLAEQLAKEPFCRKFSLERQAFAKVSQFIEQRDASSESALAESEPVKESFRRFKAIWCLFLMQLEQSAHDPASFNTLTLADYLGLAPEHPEEITMVGQITLVPTPPPSAPPIVQELVALEEEAVDRTVMGNIINFVDTAEEQESLTLTGIETPLEPSEPAAVSVLMVPEDSAPDTESPWSEAPMTPTHPVEEETKPASDWTLDASEPSTPEPVPSLDWSPEAPAAPAVATAQWEPEPVTSAAPTVQLEDTALDLALDLETDQSVDWSLPDDEKEDTIRVRVPKLKPEPAPTVEAAKEYYSVAGYFKHQRLSGGAGIAVPHLVRLEAQQICFAVELEFQERLSPHVPAFWNARPQILPPLWDKTGKEFHPDIVACWNALVEASGAWPKTDRLPVMTFRNSLKLLAMATDSAHARLSPLEAGLWLFLFGQDRSVGNVTLQNILGLPAMEEAAVADAFLRLCRVHRLKSLLVNPSSTVTEAECAELRAHAEALFDFSLSWLTRSGSGP